jgi:hypothetical protein
MINVVSIIVGQCPNDWRLDTDPSKCVIVITSARDFFDAESTCQEFDTRSHLVSIHSGFENLFIRCNTILIQSFSLFDCN